MLRFFFKKNFYDGWDSVMYLLVPNAVIDAAVLAGAALMFAGRDHLAVWLCTAPAVTIASAIFPLSWAECAAEIAGGGIPELKQFFLRLKGCVRDGVLYGLLLFAAAAAAGIGIFYYSRNTTVAGMMALCMFCWIALAVFMALFWYPALRALMRNPFGKSVRKCFILFFDNLGVNIVLGLYNLFLSAISVVMLGIAPGAAGIVLARANALRLLLRKYDYLEELDAEGVPAGDRRRRKIPWKELLAEDIEMTGTRTFKQFFMPWKD